MTMVGSLSSGDAQYGEVGFGVHADDGGAHAAPVSQQHLDLIGAADDMIVGQDVTLAADDDAGTEAGLYYLAGGR